MAMMDAKQRGLSLTEILELRHIPPEGLVFEEALDPAWVDRQLDVGRAKPVGFTCEMGPKATLSVEPLGPMETRPPILVRGRATADLRSTCVRCLADVVLPMSVEIEQTLFPDRTPDETAEPTLEELDEGAYTPEVGVDLPNVLREAILLDLAMNPTCTDVEGCDRRTQALIDEVNRANQPAVDPRWAALQRLRDSEPS